MPAHKHLIIRAEVNHPITSEKELKRWLRKLVKKIDMNIIKGPYTAYVSKEGNRDCLEGGGFPDLQNLRNPLLFGAYDFPESRRQI